MSLFRRFGVSSAAEREQERTAEVVQRAEHDPGNRETPRFDALVVLEAATVGAEQRARVERMLELLSAMPAETPVSIRKGIVEASFKAFGISVDAILEAATAELGAFTAFMAAGHRQLDELQKQACERIAQLEADIAKIQRSLDVASSDQTALDQAAIAASERVRPVLAFFRELSPRAVQADS